MEKSSQRPIRVIFSQTRNPELNLAKEKAIFFEVESRSSPDTLFFWINDECLVAGQIKSAKYGWYNQKLAEEMKIPVYKRFTGGGVVYHDLGNLNWSFFVRTNGGFRSPEKIFREYSKFIIESLKQLGLDAYFAPPNRIEVAGKKVSGMAARSGLKCLLVHGTLLLNSNLERLNLLCIPPPESPEVANLSQWLPDINSEMVMKAIVSTMQKNGYQVDQSPS
jgi:lipoate-protein ligase A